MVLKTIGFFPRRIEPRRLRFLVSFFSLLDIVDNVKSERGVDAITAVVAGVVKAMVLKTIGFFPLRIEPCRLRFLVFFSLLDRIDFVQSEIAGDVVAVVLTEWLRRWS
ncbi:hypothetical protein MRX96_003099 [Rhipicephalus microplus]